MISFCRFFWACFSFCTAACTWSTTYKRTWALLKCYNWCEEKVPCFLEIKILSTNRWFYQLPLIFDTNITETFPTAWYFCELKFQKWHIITALRIKQTPKKNCKGLGEFICSNCKPHFHRMYYITARKAWFRVKVTKSVACYRELKGNYDISVC